MNLNFICFYQAPDIKFVKKSKQSNKDLNRSVLQDILHTDNAYQVGAPMVLFNYYLL